MNHATLIELLRKEGKPWRVDAANVINEIPEGHLASYGTIAKITNRRYGHSIRALNVGWLRRHLYEISNRQGETPLHRLATQGDTNFENDSERTKQDGKVLRKREGSDINPLWWKG